MGSAKPCSRYPPCDCAGGAALLDVGPCRGATCPVGGKRALAMVLRYYRVGGGRDERQGNCYAEESPAHQSAPRENCENSSPHAAVLPVRVAQANHPCISRGGATRAAPPQRIRNRRARLAARGLTPLELSARAADSLRARCAECYLRTSSQLRTRVVRQQGETCDPRGGRPCSRAARSGGTPRRVSPARGLSRLRAAPTA